MMYLSNGYRRPLSRTSLVTVLLRLLFTMFILRISVASITHAKRLHPPLESRVQGPSSDCMNPNSQPELEVSKALCQSDSSIIRKSQIYDLCHSSQTNLTPCLASSAYKNNCLAYCEQFLYWFLGPEVPWPNSNCEPYEACTFGGSNSLAITNTYTFSAGLSGTGGDAFKVAFNLGATYTYSTTVTTTQSFQQGRPSNSTPYCGYWTFLPYYITWVASSIGEYF